MSSIVKICGLDTDTLPKINGNECERLLRAYFDTKDRQYKDQLIMANIRLVLSVVQRYREYKGSYDDLFQAGMLGLIKAIDNFDLRLNVRFSTYAVPMIIGEVRKFIREGNSIKVNRATRDVAYRCMQAKEKLQEQAKTPSLMEIAEELSLPIFEVVSALDAVAEPISLFQAVYNDGEESLLLMDQIKDEKNTDERLLERLTLKDAIASLSEKEREVIEKRYYGGKTQMEIAADTDISQAQVSRLEKSALYKMKSYFNS